VGAAMDDLKRSGSGFRVPQGLGLKSEL